MKTFRVVSLIIISFFLMSGCGYHLAGTANPMLDDYTSIAIPYFKNKSFEAEAVSIFTHAVVNEFVESNRLRVETIDKADLVLYGTVVKISESTIGYSKEDKAKEYRIMATLELSLEEKSTGEVLWKRNGLTHDEEYFSGDGNIELAEADKRKSLVILAEDLAERIHDSIVQGF